MKKIVLLAGLLVTAIFFVNAELHASTSLQVLQPGRTYEFIGINSYVVSHVDIPGGGQYEFVEMDSEGSVSRFGFSSMRVTIIGTGSTAITPLAPMPVTFNSSRVRLRITEGSVLTQTRLEPGETANIENRGLSDNHVRIRQNRAYSYDLIILDGFGSVVNSFTDTGFPQIGIPGGGSAAITANDGFLSVYFPSFLSGNVLRVSRSAQQVMVAHILFAGLEIAVSNTSDETINFAARTSPNDALFRYTYVQRGGDGHVVRYGNATGNDIRIPPRSSLHITPVINAELLFPSIFLDYVEISYGDNAPLFHALFPGESITVANTSPIRQYRIFGASGNPYGHFSLDYVMYHDEEWHWGVVRDTTAEWSFNLEPGAMVTITLTDATDYAAFRIPITSDINIVGDTGPAKIRYYLQPGESVYMANNTEISVNVMFSAKNNGPAPDYVLVNQRLNRIESFGRLDVAGSFTLGSYMSLLVTSVSYDTWVSVPGVLVEEGLAISATDRQALVRHSLRHGQTLRVDNTGRFYNRSVIIENDSNRRTGWNDFDYEFTLTQITAATNYNVFDFGVSQVGAHVLPPNNRLNIMPAEGASLSAAFPAEWLNRYIRVQTADVVPLHRITLSPGSRVSINNRTRDDFEIANNSGPGSAGFHIRRPNDTSRISPDEPRETGSISLPAGSNIVIVAAIGEELEIWMPMNWARRLGLVN